MVSMTHNTAGNPLTNTTSHYSQKPSPTPPQPRFICPHCASPLIPDTKTWRCDGSRNAKSTQHPFDVARQGYVNLLPVQNKKSKDPGDSQDSIQARHRFLAQGFYHPLRQHITELIKKTVHDGCWLDVGCGEGYYTNEVTALNNNKNTDNEAGGIVINNLIALDISKPAVALFAKTAKQNGRLWFQANNSNDSVNTDLTPIYPIVGSAAKLPLADNSVIGVSSIFSPILPKEFARVLKEGGRLIIAKPDVGHLQTLREALFDDVRLHDSDKFLQTLAPYFELQAAYHIDNPLSLAQEALSDLMTMTPYSYRAKPSKREDLLAHAKGSNFKTVAKFVVYELVKK